MLRSLVELHPSSPESPSEELYRPLTAPARALSRTYPGAPHRESFDIQRLSRQPAPGSGVVTPPNDADLEMSRPATPVPSGEAIEAVPSVWDPFMNRFRLLAMCLASLGNALNDGAAGALIPYMEK